jgi:hypothetical protein
MGPLDRRGGPCHGYLHYFHAPFTPFLHLPYSTGASTRFAMSVWLCTQDMHLS